MKLIEFTLSENLKLPKSICVNPEHVEFIAENSEGKTDIGLSSGNKWKVEHTIDVVKSRLGIED
ncbi:MAG: hypothetical protein WC854_11675 [Bacteroidales bacterium]